MTENVLVIESNNPNLLPIIVLMLAVIYIAYNLLAIKLKVNKKKRLEQTKKKIAKNHERVLLDEQVKRGKSQ